MLEAGADAPTALIRGEVTDHDILRDHIAEAEVIAIKCCPWISKACDLAIEASTSYSVEDDCALRIHLVHRVERERPDVSVPPSGTSLGDDRSGQFAVDELILQVHAEIVIPPIARPHREVAAP